MIACHICASTHNRDVRETGMCFCSCHRPPSRRNQLMNTDPLLIDTDPTPPYGIDRPVIDPPATTPLVAPQPIGRTLDAPEGPSTAQRALGVAGAILRWTLALCVWSIQYVVYLPCYFVWRMLSAGPLRWMLQWRKRGQRRHEDMIAAVRGDDDVTGKHGTGWGRATTPWLIDWARG